MEAGKNIKIVVEKTKGVLCKMSTLNVLDYIIIGVLVLGGIRVAIKGIIREIGEKSGYLVGFLCAIMFTKPLSNLLIESFSMPAFICIFISYVVLFIVGYVAMYFLGSILQNFCKSDTVDFVNRLLGFLFGIFEALIICSAVIQLLSYQSLFDFSAQIDSSIFCQRLLLPIFDTLTTAFRKTK